jgi:hypothetical protein
MDERWQEVKPPEMFQFSTQHDRLEGVLLGIARVSVKGKEVLQYLIRDVEGVRLTFLGTYDLNRKIQPEHIGHPIKVVYEGELQDVKTKGSPLRKFSVHVKPTKAPGFQNLHGVTVTDEDVPF